MHRNNQCVEDKYAEPAAGADTADRVRQEGEERSAVRPTLGHFIGHEVCLRSNEAALIRFCVPVGIVTAFTLLGVF